MRMYLRNAMALPSLALALFLAGCSANQYGDMGLVSGTVTLDGKPYPNAEVTFAPQEGRPSSGLTDEQGRYELRYIRTTMGAVPGEHRVRIETTPPLRDPSYRGPAFKDPIPAQYNRRSELTAVVEKGPNSIDFKLLSK